VVVEVSLPDNVAPIVNNALQFQVEIGNVCEGNSISMVPMQPIMYFLRTPTEK